MSSLETLFPVLLDNASVYPEWRQLVAAHAVSGVRVHDARIVAAMNVHGVGRLVTFNDQDFRRYRGITVMTPAEVIKSYHPKTIS